VLEQVPDIYKIRNRQQVNEFNCGMLSTLYVKVQYQINYLSDALDNTSC